MSIKKFDELNLKKHKTGSVAQEPCNLEVVIEALNSKSCSLCLAKFRQVTLHLGQGLVHSCHHPKVHAIPEEDVKKDPSVLFNTPELKKAREQMLNGKYPAECDYCWRIEADKGTSDRFYKSCEDWAITGWDEIVNSTGAEKFKPTYLEVSFSNICNLKCIYCGPEFSSKWTAELKEFGPMMYSDGGWASGWQDLDSLQCAEDNAYTKAFWNWFPEVLPGLKHFRITGGEPLLHKNAMKCLDYIAENPVPDLEFAINTNLTVSEKIWTEFLEKLIALEKSGNLKKITIYTSFEGWGERSEYARTGSTFHLITGRFEELLKKTKVRCVVMATYNLLAVTSFKEVLEWILVMKKKYNFNHQRHNLLQNTGYDVRSNASEQNVNSFRVGIDIPYLRHPVWLDTQLASDELLLNYMIPCLEFMVENEGRSSLAMHLGFEPYEVEKFERIIVHRMYFKKKHIGADREDIAGARQKFYEMIELLDQRRGTDFLSVFPEMSDFYLECKKAKDE